MREERDPRSTTLEFAAWALLGSWIVIVALAMSHCPVDDACARAPAVNVQVAQ